MFAGIVLAVEKIMILEKKAGAGQKVNLEVDWLARYMERLMPGNSAAKGTNIVTQGLLQQSGFIE
jgi:riboflavin synthase alpha subunit